ncbi:MAG: MopE-related protein [Deltaproteobacteria bacterium]|nr:MopE-related protein [Deltaproteobacteria bacterium]
MRVPVLPVVLTASLGLASACFSPAPVNGDVILCANNLECPAPLICDLVTHTCGDTDQNVLPSVVVAAFDPAFASSGTVRLLITADENLSPGEPPVATFAGSALPLAAQPPEGSTQELVIDVDDGVAEGVYRLTSLRLTSAAGLADTSPVDEILVVDRTPPALGELALEDGTSAVAGLLLGDVAPHDVVAVRFSSSEPLVTDGIRVLLGARVTAGACALDDVDRLIFACEIAVESSDGDGETALRVEAVDVAGNPAALQTAVLIDTAAPTLLAGSALALVFAPGGRTLSAAATPGGDIEVVFTAAEDLAVPPLVALRLADDDDQAFTLLSTSGRTFRYGLTVQPSLAAVGVIVATLEDRVGHRSVDVPVDLPAPFAAGIPVGDAVVTTCPTRGFTCLDVDGDGAFAASALCPAGNDCNDLEPVAFGGATEIPGDGVDNDCGGDGDGAIDETSGVFVAADGDDGAAGTRAAPLRTVAAAAAATSSSRPNIFVAAGGQVTVGGVLEIEGALVGGLDRQSWTPGGITQLIGSGFGDLSVSGAAAGVTSNAGMFAEDNALIVGNQGQIDVVGANVVVVEHGLGSGALSNDNLVVQGTARDAHIVEPQAVRLITRSSPLGLPPTKSTVVGGVLRLFDVTSDVDFVNVYFVNDSDDVRGRVRFFHCTFERLVDEPFNFAAAGDVDVVGSLFFGGAVGGTITALSVPASAGINTVRLVAVNFVGTPVRDSAGTGFSIDQVSACSFPGCEEAVDISSGNPSRDSLDPRHLQGPSIARDRGVDSVAEGAPSAVLLDIDGDCRYADGLADLGPDEL